MAQLPPDGEWVIQQIDGEVVLYNIYTEEELISFNPANADECGKAQGLIHKLTQLTEEQKSMAHFWSGYFYAHSH